METIVRCVSGATLSKGRMKTPLLVFPLVLLLTACTTPPTGGPGATVSAGPEVAPPSSAPVARPPEATTAMTLAMSDPGGSMPVDAEVRGAQQWVRRLPKSNDKLIELGRAWIVKARHAADPGYYLNAKACAELVLEREQDSWLGRELLAQVLLNQHKFADAKDMCEQVLARDKEAFITLGVYSDTLLELGREDEAIKAADRMVAFKPNGASYVRVSFLHWLLGDLGAALNAAKLAIESSNDPGAPEPKAYALVQAANFFWHKGDYEGAQAGYTKATSALTNYAPALLGLGRVALAQGNEKRAVELIELANKESPTVEIAWRLGDARAAAGDTAGADEAYGWVVKRGRQSDPRTLAHFYAVKNRDIEEAVKLAEAEMRERPGVFTQNVYAWALYRAGKLEQAKTTIERATRLGTKEPELLYHLGAIKIATGDRTAGKMLVKEALALNPHFDPTAAPEANALAGR
jgi:tetratricopeptide (TPR) repeat protein